MAKETRSGRLKTKLRALDRGRSGERLAVLHLRLRGWKIAARNFRCGRGEIDIIARKGNLVAFVEVKARQTVDESVAAVSSLSRQRIAAAASEWISRQHDGALLSWRHDIMAVCPWRWPVHLPDAF